jgi:hypothetical protein
MYWNWDKCNIVILKIYIVDWNYYFSLNSFHLHDLFTLKTCGRVPTQPTRFFTCFYLESSIWLDEILRWIRQGMCFKFLANLRKRAAETLAMIRQAFGVESVSPTQKVQTHRDRKGETGEKQSQEHAYYFLWHQGFCSCMPDSQFRILLWRFMVTAWKWVKTSPQLWQQKNWLLHHDNALSGTTFLTRKFFLPKTKWLIPHPPHPPYLAPCCPSLFSQLKIKLKSRHFDTIDVIRAESQAILNTVTGHDFQDAFKKWLGMMHTHRRGLLWWWWWPVGLRPGAHDRCVDWRCYARHCVRKSLTSHYTDGATWPMSVDCIARSNARYIFYLHGHATTDVRSCAMRCNVSQSALELFTWWLVWHASVIACAEVFATRINSWRYWHQSLCHKILHLHRWSENLNLLLLIILRNSNAYN